LEFNWTNKYLNGVDETFNKNIKATVEWWSDDLALEKFVHSNVAG
jgi:hypothetical protein